MNKSDKILLLLIVSTVVAVLVYVIPKYQAGNVHEVVVSPYCDCYDDDFLPYSTYFY